MNRPYTAQSPYSLTPTERIESPRRGRRYAGGHGSADRYADPYGEPDGDLITDTLPPYPGDYDPDGPIEDYDDYDIDEASVDRRWMWIAGIAGAILFVAVIAASLILGGGDSGSVSATIASSQGAPTSSSAPEPSAPRVAAPPSLPPETVTTVTPSPTPSATATPTAQPVLPPPQAAPPPAAVAPGTVTYRITGDRSLIDLVTVIYTDQRGALVTDVNVALPWSKTVVLDPGVTLSSVTATSVRGQLNCSITDANGAVIAAQNSNSFITNCTR
ncbi:hypothetical protein [Mycolicibacterium hippocampi]|uniref:Transport accessory protein MmpS3 n=1 Tax=Mycolicibacterium hippocampi TaxID=659824 RepID=A0A7I9ZLX5_9MYCO|nr:hypothetical protein [Mycolicibacterium hippocampi]GFH02025.1 hypothetical protein MHIP_25080 [Mycolicibacterium hippocampi]